jgi:hypothetical protein
MTVVPRTRRLRTEADSLCEYSIKVATSNGGIN